MLTTMPMSMLMSNSPPSHLHRYVYYKFVLANGRQTKDAMVEIMQVTAETIQTI